MMCANGPGRAQHRRTCSVRACVLLCPKPSHPPKIGTSLLPFEQQHTGAEAYVFVPLPCGGAAPDGRPPGEERKSEGVFFVCCTTRGDV